MQKCLRIKWSLYAKKIHSHIEPNCSNFECRDFVAWGCFAIHLLKLDCKLLNCSLLLCTHLSCAIRPTNACLETIYTSRWKLICVIASLCLVFLGRVLQILHISVINYRIAKQFLICYNQWPWLSPVKY